MYIYRDTNYDLKPEKTLLNKISPIIISFYVSTVEKKIGEFSLILRDIFSFLLP